MMTDEPMGRREWLRAIGRGVVAAMLVALVTLLVRRGRGRDGFLSCDRRYVCRGCPRLQECDLPSARDQRKVGTDSQQQSLSGEDRG